MRRAVKGGTRGITGVLAVLGLVAMGLLGWRELSHRQAESQWLGEQTRLEMELEEREQAKREQSARAELAETALAEARLSLQGLGDRATNLEAQRDHLRAEVDRLAERNREAEASFEDLRVSLESSREALLQAEALPDSLRGELSRERERNARLEARLDQAAAGNTGNPPLLEVAGASQDGTVFALSGTLPEQSTLPVKVYVCRSDRIILEGWLNRIEDEAIIGHVLRWESPASALVKGEKVFILPGNSHEAD